MKNELPTEARAERARRLAALGYDYDAQPKRDVTHCNLCGSERLIVVAHRDRYGFAAQARGCADCGLVFLAPVMTAEAYGNFYNAIYRPLVSAFHGRLIDHSTLQHEQRAYATERAAFIAPFLAQRHCRTLLDIGGSTGVVAHAWAEAFDLEATIIDPAPLEIAEAQRLGLETITGFVEQYDPGDRRFDVVALCQTIDHLLDISSTLHAVRRVLSDDGLLFVDIVDLRAAYLRTWSIEGAVKIDHPYYLTDETARAYLMRAGLAVQRVDFSADHLHIAYVCKPVAPDPAGRPDPASVAKLFREIRFVQNAPPR